MEKDTTKSSNRRNQILGGTLGAVAGFIIVTLVVFFLRRRRAQRTEENEISRTASLVENSPVNVAPSSPFSAAGSSKAQLMMLYGNGNGGGPSAVSPSSGSGSPAGEASRPSDSSQQQQTGFVPQRSHLHVTNLAPGEEKPLPSPMLQPERPDQNLRREVEQLRMEMDAIRAAGQDQQPHVLTEEPPPRYTD